MTMTDSPDRVPEGKEALDLSAAANRLRLPIASVEKALERGFVDGYRNASGEWVVLLDKPSPFPPVDEAEMEALDAMADDVVDIRPADADDFADYLEMPEYAETAADDLADDLGEDVLGTEVDLPTYETAVDVTPEIGPDSPVRRPAVPADNGSVAELSALVRHLEEEVRYLREEVVRREAGANEKDQTILRLMNRFADMNEAMVKRIPSSDAIYLQIEQAVRSQRHESERHERELNSIKDVLSSVRSFLSKTREQERK